MLNKILKTFSRIIQLSITKFRPNRFNEQLYISITETIDENCGSDNQFALNTSHSTGYDGTLLENWNAFSDAERQIVALICLGRSVDQIAVCMGIGNHSVVASEVIIFQKFSVKNQTELRSLLRDWDFSAWGNPDQ